MDRKTELIVNTIEKAKMAKRIKLVIQETHGTVQLYLREGHRSVMISDHYDAEAVIARWDFRNELNDYLSERYLATI